MLVKILTTRAKRAITNSLTFTLPKVKVKVEQGNVIGVLEKLPNQRSFQRFSGIPYAKPPVNELRFRSPEKLLKFENDELDCTRESSPSFHRSSIWKKYIGSEDCLNLNIYVPEVESSKKLAVMVFIHGGGFLFDSNSRDFYSPEYLLMNDVIVVTINYRFQAFGFLCLPSMGISGNATLKDQQLALTWVHENISNFGGDSDKICLFGESAGAASVHLQLLNPKSRKLINTAIMQSNCVLADWLFQKHGEEKSRRLGKRLGAKSNSDEDILNALMSASAQQIYENSSKVFDPDEFRRNLPFVFKPVIENVSDDAFITQKPLELLKTEKIDIPIIMGMLDGDGMTMGSYYRNKKLHSFESDYVRLVPLSLQVEPDSDEAKSLGKKIKEFYFGNQMIDERTITEFVDFMTDYHFTIPQTMCNELHARFQPNSKQFVYEFRYDGELNLFKILLGMTDISKAAHFDELFYLFDAKLIGKEVSENSSAWIMRETMCKMWSNFAKYGDPTPVGKNPLPFAWKPVQSVEKNAEHVDIEYLMINEKSEMMKNMYKNRIGFWRKLYEKYNNSFLNPKF